MLLFAAAASGPVAAGAANSAPRPNIILILSDDVGLGDVHCTGGPFETPNLDALAAGGTNFTHCYATPLCGPSRCQLLTGRYPFRTGHNSNQSRMAVDPSDEVMIPSVLKKAGYVTASVGKWGQIQLGPGEWGFDEYLVYPGSGRYWRDQTTFYTVNGKRHDLPEGQHLPDIMHEFIADFIDRHQDRPFFVYYSMSHMHGPIVRTPDSQPGADKDQLYTDNVEYMDKLIGRLVEELDRRQLREKTLVIFTGDNGTARMGVELATVNGRAISGQKGSMLEGGSRVPLVVNWPGTTPAGKSNDDLVDFSDYFVTLADLAGAELPPGVTYDGNSFAGQIQGEEGSKRQWVYVELNGNSYVRDARFKLTNRGQMFELSQAPYVEAPVAADTTDPDALAARKKLQEVLDEHPAAARNPNAGKKAVKKQRAARKQAARAKKARRARQQ
jgi:arylsulfatase A